MKILVTGGTGFVGPKIVHALRARSYDVRALVRNPARAGQLASWGVELAVGDVTDPASVRAAMRDCTHAVHLVAIICGRPQDFHRVMTQGLQHVLAAAKEERIGGRFVLMSALGTREEEKETVPYYRAKWHMEQDVKSSGLEYTIFRPSFVFGRDGGVLPTFVRQVRYSPVVTVIGPGLQKSQPIWVDDVAAYFAKGVGLPAAASRTFELGGPDVVTWNELYARIAQGLGKRRRRLNRPVSLVRAAAATVQGGDNIVSSTDAVDTFQLPLVALDEQIRRAA